MFLNKNRKFRKSRLFGLQTSWKITKPTLNFCYAIRALETGYITVAQLEAARKALQKFLRRHRRLRFLQVRVLATISRSKKKKGMRMGGSKGGFYCYVYRAKPGALLFEIRSFLTYQVRRRLRFILSKLPIQVSLVVLRSWKLLR